MADNQTPSIWYKLLIQYPSEWNEVIYYLYGDQIRSLILEDEFEHIRRSLDRCFPWSDGRSLEIKGIINQIGGFPPWPKDGSSALESFMDFRKISFSDNTAFTDLILIGANFEKATFEGWSDFQNTTFLGLTHFDKVKFTGIRSSPAKKHSIVSFENSIFEHTVYFDQASLPRTFKFESTYFKGAAYFRKTEFHSHDFGSVSFNNAKFKSVCDFTSASINSDIEFKTTEFCDNTRFVETSFKSNVNFSGAKFKNTTSFRKAKFDKMPKFFETEVHEDVDFSNVNWDDAEYCYSQFMRFKHKKEYDIFLEEVENAIRAWDRLALIMGEQEKLHERHAFFRRRMRAERVRDGKWAISSIANKFYELLSDYGWGAGSAFFWWAGHIIVFALILFCVNIALDNSSLEHLKLFGGSLLASFSNSLSFLGLTDIHLQSVHSMFEGQLVYSIIGTIQAILGPVFLFLLLLTLRNRFRMK
ncbi:MAG: hypothetical protein OXC63_02100 [Aestuariivita sp.]|nr:hypothetical protein [Aestuariivita sp.]MCY4347609.1 hypothetical protein [Aestuariivita sp.]